MEAKQRTQPQNKRPLNQGGFRLAIKSTAGRFAAQLSCRGWAQIRVSKDEHATLGLTDLFGHDEFLAEGVQEREAAKIFSALVRHIAIGQQYAPGQYEVLGRKMTVTAMDAASVEKKVPAINAIRNAPTRVVKLLFG